MLGAMLGAQNGVLTVPECNFFNKVLKKFSNLEDVQPEVVLAEIQQHWQIKVWDIDTGSLYYELGKEPVSVQSVFEELILAYGKTVGSEKFNIWVDHTPETIYHITSRLNLSSNTKIVHIVRDGRAIAASIMKLDWGPNTIVPAAKLWINRTTWGAAAETRYPENIIRVYYEDLLLRSEVTLKNVCRFLDLDYKPEMLAPVGFKVPEYTRKQHHLIGNPLDPDRVDAWKQILTDREIEIFESMAYEILSYFNYEPLYGLGANSITKSEHIKMMEDEVRLRKINRQKKMERLYSTT